VRSKTSYFNLGIAKNMLRRSWPLWCAYLAILVLVLPVGLSAAMANASAGEIDFFSIDYIVQRAVYSAGRTSVQLTVPMAVISAMTVFGFLYFKRSCGMMASLPVRREEVFATAFLCGLVPVLLSQVVAAGICALIVSANTYCSPNCVWLFVGYSAVTYTAFYCFSVFCAQLTGNIIALPAVYVVFNCVAAVVGECVNSILNMIVYGFNGFSLDAPFLAPGAAALFNFDFYEDYTAESDAAGLNRFVYSISLGKLAAICLVSAVIFALWALVLYKRRHMETAGDVIAVKALKPVFRYCMSFGAALVLAAVMFSSIIDLSNLVYGTKRYVVLLLIMLAGAAIGYFIAEMLIQKSVRIFPCKIKELLITMGILTVLSLSAELDLTGMEKYVPDPEDIESVDIYSYFEYCNDILRGDEAIALTRKLHQSIIDDKAQLEKTRGKYLYLTYYLKNGSTVERRYQLPNSTETKQLYMLEELKNTREAIMGRTEADIGSELWRITYGDVYSWTAGDDYLSLQLTAQQAQELYSQCLIPDAQDGNINICYVVPDGDMEREETYATVTLYIYTGGAPGNMLEAAGEAVEEKYYNNVVNYTVNVRSARTMQWLNEQGIKVCTEEDIEKQYAETEAE